MHLFVLTGDVYFQGNGVILVFVSWLSHIVCCVVKHGHLRRGYSYSHTFYSSPLPLRRRLVGLPHSDIAQFCALFRSHLCGALERAP